MLEVKEMEVHFHKNEFGICPLCGKPLLLYATNRQMFKLNPGGTAIKEQASLEDLWYICTCGFASKAKKTIEGIRPVEYANRIDNISIDTKNPVGKVED
jgi:hypothetical protein